MRWSLGYHLVVFFIVGSILYLKFRFYICFILQQNTLDFVILKDGFITTTTFSFIAAVSAVSHTGHAFPVSFSSYISILFLVCAKRAKY